MLDILFGFANIRAVSRIRCLANLSKRLSSRSNVTTKQPVTQDTYSEIYTSFIRLNGFFQIKHNLQLLLRRPDIISMLIFNSLSTFPCFPALGKHGFQFVWLFASPGRSFFSAKFSSILEINSNFVYYIRTCFSAESKIKRYSPRSFTIP